MRITIAGLPPAHQVPIFSHPNRSALEKPYSISDPLRDKRNQHVTMP